MDPTSQVTFRGDMGQSEKLPKQDMQQPNALEVVAWPWPDNFITNNAEYALQTWIPRVHKSEKQDTAGNVKEAWRHTEYQEQEEARRGPRESSSRCSEALNRPNKNSMPLNNPKMESNMALGSHVGKQRLTNCFPVDPSPTEHMQKSQRCRQQNAQEQARRVFTSVEAAEPMDEKQKRFQFIALCFGLIGSALGIRNDIG